MPIISSNHFSLLNHIWIACITLNYSTDGEMIPPLKKHWTLRWQYGITLLFIPKIPHFSHWPLSMDHMVEILQSIHLIFRLGCAQSLEIQLIFNKDVGPHACMETGESHICSPSWSWGRHVQLKFWIIIEGPQGPNKTLQIKFYNDMIHWIRKRDIDSLYGGKQCTLISNFKQYKQKLLVLPFFFFLFFFLILK